MSAVGQVGRHADLSAMIAGPCATFLGVGVARFAYAPLVPAMISAGWLSAGAAGLLGAVNFGGYLGGALVAPALARRLGAVRTLRLVMLVTAIALAPCAWRGGLVWLLPWRILSGATGGILMVLAGPTVQAFLPPRLRGLSAGLMFTGVGAGSVIGTLMVPALLPHGLPATWLALSATGFVVTAFAWTLWPRAPATPAAVPRAPPPPIRSRGAVALVICYGLCGIAAAPHMQWWPDFVARGLGEGVAAGARSWLVWGIAAASAPVLLGRLADLIGGRPALIVGLVLQALALLIPLLDASLASQLVSVVLAGGTTTATSGLILTRTRELAGAGSARLWSVCTSCFAASQTAAAFFLAWLYTETGSHLPLFATGFVAAVGACLLVRK